MIKVRASTENQKTMRFLTELPIELTKAIRKAFYISGKYLVADLNKDMRQEKSGKKYKVYKGVSGNLKRAKEHTASAPSETPAVITGRFRKSVDFAVRGNRELEFGANENAPEYAIFLEEGTSKMDARKPFKRIVLKNKERIRNYIDIELKKVLRGKK